MAGLLREQVQLFEAQSELHRPDARRRRAARRARRPEPARPGRRQPALERDQVLARGRYRRGRRRAVERRRARDRARRRPRHPDEQQDRIFTKFFRATPRRAASPGSGLGLAFARAVVEAHGGRMGFTSARGAGRRSSSSCRRRGLSPAGDSEPPREKETPVMRSMLTALALALVGLTTRSRRPVGRDRTGADPDLGPADVVHARRRRQAAHGAPETWRSSAPLCSTAA